MSETKKDIRETLSIEDREEFDMQIEEEVEGLLEDVTEPERQSLTHKEWSDLEDKAQENITPFWKEDVEEGRVILDANPTDNFILECKEFERDLEEEANEQINMKAKINTPEYQLTLTRLVQIYGKGGLYPK